MDLKIADWLKALVFAAVLVLTYIFFGTIIQLILLVVLASIIVYLVNPLVSLVERRIKSRTWAVLLAYLAFLLILAGVIALLVPLIGREFANFADDLPGYVAAIERWIEAVDRYLDRTAIGGMVDLDPATLLSQAVSAVAADIQQIVGIIPATIAILGQILLVLVISLYILLLLPIMHEKFKNAASDDLKVIYERFVVYLGGQVSKYVKGQLILMTTVGVVTGLALWLIGLPYAVVLGIVAGLFEIIPYFGPVLTGVVAILVALTVSPATALLALLVVVVVQTLESNTLSPLILGKTVEINPLAVLLVLLVGGELLGILGIILAVPIFVILRSTYFFVRENFAYIRSKEGPDRIVVKSSASEQEA
jgi:predicted PurR-regulated permease PerM